MSDNDISVTTTLGSDLNSEQIEVEPEQYQPPSPPEAEIVTTTTTDSQNAISANDGVGLPDSSLRDYRELDDGKTRITSVEAPDSSRHRVEGTLSEYERALDTLKFPQDAELLDQMAEQGEVPPPQPQPEANMIPAEQVGELVERQVIIREHQARMAQALQDPDFAAYLAAAPEPDVVWAPEIGTAVAAQANSPVVVAYLSSNPELASRLRPCRLRGVWPRYQNCRHGYRPSCSHKLPRVGYHTRRHPHRSGRLGAARPQRTPLISTLVITRPTAASAIGRRRTATPDKETQCPSYSLR